MFFGPLFQTVDVVVVGDPNGMFLAVEVLCSAMRLIFRFLSPVREDDQCVLYWSVFDVGHPPCVISLFCGCRSQLG